MATPALTPTPKQHRRRSYYDTTSTLSSPALSASVHEQRTFNSHPGHQSGGCQLLLSSSNNENGINNPTKRIGQQQRRTSLTTTNILRTPPKKISQRRQSTTDLSAFGEDVLAKRLSSSCGALYLETSTTTNLPPPTATTPTLQRRRSYYETDTALASTLQKSKFNSHPGHQSGGCQVLLSSNSIKHNSNNGRARRVGQQQRRTSLTRASLLRRQQSSTDSFSKDARAERRGSSCGALHHMLNSTSANVSNRGVGRRRSISENFGCFTESVFKTLDERRNSSWSNVIFHKNSSSVKLTAIGFLQLLNNQDWLYLQEQYLDTEGGSMVIMELVMMHHLEFQALLLLAAGQPDMDFAGNSKSCSAPTLLHEACSHKAPWAVVHRILSLAPCSVYDLNTHTGQNVLHVAAQKGCITQVLDLLIHLAPELASQKDVHGRFPLHYLCMPLAIKEQEPPRELISSNIRTSRDNDNGTRLPRKFKSATDRMLTLKMVNQFCHAHPKAITTTDHHTGMSPLMYAVTHGAHADILDRMMKLPQVLE
jgi:hypothetical protein